MRTEVKKLLKEKGKLDLFTDTRFEKVKAMMQFGMRVDRQLKNLLSLDPLNKAQFVADHIIRLVELNEI